jgi:hypothetical protein
MSAHYSEREVTTYDVHQHLWPESLVGALAERTSPPLLHGHTLVLEHEGSFQIDPADYGLEACLRNLDRTRVDVAVVSCPPTLGIALLPESEAEELRSAYHEGALAAAAESGGRLLPLSMDRAEDDFVGAILAADDVAELNDDVSARLDELERRGMFVLVHPGVAHPPADAPPWWAATVDYTAQMQRAYASWLAYGVERWPDLRIVFAILAGGAPFQLERMQARGFEIANALRPTIFLETSSYGRRALELCLATFGARQIVFGSDAPVVEPMTTLAHVRSFGQAATEALCQHNPTTLLT